MVEVWLAAPSQCYSAVCDATSCQVTGKEYEEWHVVMNRGSSSVNFVTFRMQAWAALEGRKGEPKKAQRLFEAAAKAEPDNAMLLNTWATYEKRRGDATKAKELYKKALDSNSSHVPSIQVKCLLSVQGQ